MVRQPAGPVHRLCHPDGALLSGWPPAPRADLADRAVLARPARDRRLRWPGQAGASAGDRQRRLPAAGRSRVRTVADVHHRDRLHFSRSAARPDRTVGSAPAGLSGSGPLQPRPRGGHLRCCDRGHGGGERGLHPRSPAVARPVHPFPHARPPADRAEPEMGRRGRGGHILVAYPAAAAGPVLLQLPAVHRAVSDHREDNVGGSSATRDGHLDRLLQSRQHTVAGGRLGHGQFADRDTRVRRGLCCRPGGPGQARHARTALAVQLRGASGDTGAGRVLRTSWRPLARADRHPARRAARAVPQHVQAGTGHRRGVGPWLRACYGPMLAAEHSTRPVQTPGRNRADGTGRRASPGRARASAAHRAGAAGRVVHERARLLVQGSRLPGCSLAAGDRAGRSGGPARAVHLGRHHRRPA